uniref:Protein Atg16l2 n=1 Tax=Monodelphis domestica TaxID=13616 RepID=A0A5F8G2H9_MONDO
MPGPGTFGPSSLPASPRCWKLHIVRQLQQRDRRQKTMFLDLVEAYHRLLEKSDLLAHFTEKLPPELPNDPVHLPSGEEEARPVPDSCPSARGLQEEMGGGLARSSWSCGEMAYQVVEKNRALSAQDGLLEEQRGRLAALEARARELEEMRQWLAQRVAGQQDRITEGKEAYDTLRAHASHQQGALRQLEEEGRELVERLVRVKMQAAEDQNYRNERIDRVKQARLSKELKKAVKKTVNITETIDPPAIPEPPPRKQDLLEVEACEKRWKRPFRSASATSMTLTRCMDVMKGLLDFRKRRGHSVSGLPEARYPSIPVRGVSCLPARAQDVQEAHHSEVNAVCFSSNSSLLATGGADRLIHLWNVVGGLLEADQTLEGAGGSVTSLEFEPSGCFLLAATYNKAAQLWKVGESQSKETLSGHTDKVTAAKFKLTRQQAVTGSRDRTVKEWDLNKASCSRTIDGLSYCNDVVCGDHLIISGHNDQKIRFWDSRVPRCIQVIPVEGKVTSLSISSDQLHLLSCSRDDTLKVIDLRANNIRQVFSPDKSYALAGSADGGLYIWDLESGKLETRLYGPHSAPINAVAWCFAGTHVVSVDQGRKAVLWS